MNKWIAALALAGSVSFTTVAADDWFLRFGAVNVSPNSDSGPVLGNDGVEVGSDTQFGFNITYMLDDTWGIELLGANIFEHKITGTGSLAGADIGITEHLPPTISAVYNMKSDDTLYHVGVGLNYTKFFSDYPGTDAQGLGVTNLELDASTGLAFKAGFDTPIADNWYFSGAVYYIMINTDAAVLAGDALVTTVDVDINPWVLMLGIGTSF